MLGLLALLGGSLWLAPNPATAAPVAPLDVVTTPDAPMSAVAVVPESGAPLTSAVWRMAIGQAAVDAGERKLGAPYSYSAGGPDAFDCSGFTRWAWLQMGVELPHNSGAQWAMV